MCLFITECSTIKDEILSEVFDNALPDIENALANTIKDYVQEFLNLIPATEIFIGLEIEINDLPPLSINASPKI